MLYRRQLPGFLLVAVLLIVLPSAAQTGPGEFTVVALPDTQFYSASYPQIFKAQTQWIANNVDSLNIKFVLGLGDIVDKGSSSTQWNNADAAVKLMEGAVPYFLIVGNRDYETLSATKRTATNFNKYFGPARYSGRSWYRGNYQNSNENFWGVVNVNGTNYLILCLELYPRDAVLAWADQVVDSNLDKEVIVITHSFTYTDGSRMDRCDEGIYATYGNDGDAIWDKFVRKHSNIFLVLNGHKSYTGRRSDLGDNGNLVNQVLSDYQSGTNGGNGYLRILTFKPASNQITVKTYSPYLKAYLTDSANQFTMYYHAPAITATTGGVNGKVRVDRIGSTQDCSVVAGMNVQTPYASTLTSSSGKYSFGSVPPSSFNETFSKSSWTTVTVPVRVDAGYTASANAFVAPKMGTIAGVVRNTSGTAISGATVKISGGIVKFAKTSTTNASGGYSFRNISVGTYSVTVSKTGFTTLQTTTTVSANSTSTTDLKIQ